MQTFCHIYLNGNAASHKVSVLVCQTKNVIHHESLLWKVPNSNQSIIENQTIMSHNLIVFFCVNYCVKVAKPIKLQLLYNIILFCSMFKIKKRSLEALVVFLFNIKSCYVEVK